ncbi:hypothetical protein L249_6695 [Ophiocordyceps polyrhachis-furcata BCC 54312]|uniref:Uncharacterized protein n=1 Tax=Ophiocordyceps polyrhachis-furcata BCC 54312 TaxID=1330021 RepID=A0A367LLE1_9HYPO|nr:hypothetical protein L249_6695 [Ophiocordyceps polyrhachis-furcata BCC 54312]
MGRTDRRDGDENSEALRTSTRFVYTLVDGATYCSSAWRGAKEESKRKGPRGTRKKEKKNEDIATRPGGRETPPGPGPLRAVPPGIHPLFGGRVGPVAGRQHRPSPALRHNRGATERRPPRLPCGAD